MSSSILKFVKRFAVGSLVVAGGYGIMTWTNKKGDKLEKDLRYSLETSGAMSEEQRKKRLIMQNIFDNMKSDRPIWDVRWDPHAVEKAELKKQQKDGRD